MSGKHSEEGLCSCLYSPRATRRAVRIAAIVSVQTEVGQIVVVGRRRGPSLQEFENYFLSRHFKPDTSCQIRWYSCSRHILSPLGPIVCQSIGYFFRNLCLMSGGVLFSQRISLRLLEGHFFLITTLQPIGIHPLTKPTSLSDNIHPFDNFLFLPIQQVEQPFLKHSHPNLQVFPL